VGGLRNDRVCDSQDSGIGRCGSRIWRCRVASGGEVVMCGRAILKVGLAVFYALFAARKRGLGFDGQLARTQLKYSLPFAMGSFFRLARRPTNGS
jgi:hypothetical protein